MTATATIHESDHMSSGTFDTLAYAKKLKAAGFTEQQAEVQAEAIFEMIDEKLATKRDLRELEERLMNKITIRMGSMMIAAVTILAVLIKIL